RVPPNYDSMVGKLICHADDRAQCVERTARALREFEVGPIKTTIPLQLQLMERSEFRTGGVDIHHLERLLK
ncbi:MAG: acetyl-CoA carboxylase biotin carboxylase subunit, partial [Phycisphaerales bacterium]|nr:acetyl-CoA carboxylase biotin carboxylase subunit [Phycisphaerales bacterium]